MKQKLLHFLFVIAAIITAIPIANAAASDWQIGQPTQTWSQPLNPSSDAKIASYASNYMQAAASDGNIYTVPAIGDIGEMVTYTSSTTTSYMTQGYMFGNEGQSTWSGGNSSSAMKYGSSGNYYYLGSGIASDDAGTIWCQSRRCSYAPSSNPWQVGLRGVTYYTKRAQLEDVSTTRIGINLYSAGFSSSARHDLFSAYGDGVNGTGYLWAAIGLTNTSNIECIIIKNAVATGKNIFKSPVANSGTRAYAKQFSTNRVLWNQNGSGSSTSTLYVGTLDGATPENSTVISWESTGLTVCRHGSTAFILAGHEIIAYSKSTTQIALYDYTNKVEIGTITPYNSVSTNSYISHSLDAKVSGNTADLYVYVPGAGGAKYTISAIAITAPVSSPTAALVNESSTEVNVTWGKPSQGTATKYAISYSSDGGSTWSTAVETTDLSYTFTDLTTGTYKFKVTPYFGGSSTWGPESIAPESIEVITAAGAPISNLAYTYLNNTETNVGRQDITLTWNAPTGMVNTTVTGYKVYRNGSLLTTLGADALTYTNTGVKQNYTYKVVPTFDGLTEDASFGLEVTTTEVQAGVLVAPVISETRNYEGYSLVEIFFKMPNYAPYKPLYFNLYRDGKLIQGKLQSYNTLDESLVRASVETTVKYQVEAVYGTAADVYPPIDSVKSDITTLVIAPRDWAKTGYILQEVYNVPIDEISGTIPSDFSKVDYYRQGQFNKAEKKWYIAQRGNATDGVAGVITFDAETKDDVIKGSTQYYNHVVDANVGIAIDDVGTILIKNNNNTTLAASIPTSTSINSHAETGRTEYAIPTWLNDKYDRRITSALLIAKDGTTKEVDLSNVWIGTNGFVNDMYFNLEAAYTNNGVTNYSTDYGQTRGRSDYYYMWGDVLSANGGYLVFSPSWTRTAFKVKIANGAYVSHEVIEFNRYENTGYLLEPKTGTENYGFKLDGRDDVTVQIRSNGYYGVHEWNKEGTTGWHPIFTADSRINNAGGTSIQAFGEVDGTGRHTGELFVITPQSMHSHNVGDFLISRATKENADDYADEGSLMPSTPVAQYIQTDERSNSTATNANGNWFHAEKGTYASAMKDDDECVDIYQYVPGTRFARYRLIPSNQFPPVQPTLDITTAYNDDKTDITHFDGVATWQRPAGFGRSTGSANAKVVSYLFEMHNNKNELVSSAELPELYKTDGTPVDDEYVYDFNYTDTTGNKDIDFGRYSVNVRVKYQTKDGLYHISDPLYAEDIHDYPAKPAENLYIEAFIAEDITIGGWTQKDDGSWVVETQKADRYRIDLDFSKPTDAEPVSYYTLKAVVNKTADYKGDTINIENFLLHNGAEIKDGKLWAKTTSTSQIPGTYDFDNAKAPYYTTVDANGEGLYNVTDGGSRQKVVLSYFYDVPVNNAGIATVANGDEVVINNTPDEWEFIIVAHYAARNTYIDKSKLVGITPNGLTPTGVEVVGDDNILAVQIYPIPAHSTITVKSPEAINSIVIYNEAGVEVMNINGDGETIATVNIEDLATGFYFVKVNNNAPVKIIKK